MTWETSILILIIYIRLNLHLQSFTPLNYNNYILYIYILLCISIVTLQCAYRYLSKNVINGFNYDHPNSQWCGLRENIQENQSIDHPIVQQPALSPRFRPPRCVHHPPLSPWHEPR